MDNIMLKFGSTFKHKEKDYVYLAHMVKELTKDIVIES